MARASIPMIPKDGTILINDNTGTPLALTIQYEDGDFAVTNIKASQLAVQGFKDRGVTYSVRSTEDENIEFSFTAHAIAFRGDGTTADIGDVVLRTSVWAAAVSMAGSTAALGDAYLLKVTFTGERSNFGATSDTTCVLKYCHLTMDFSEGVPGKFSIKGTLFPLSTDYLTVTG